MAVEVPIILTYTATVSVPSVGDGSARLSIDGYVSVFDPAYKRIAALLGESFETTVKLEFTPKVPSA